MTDDAVPAAPRPAFPARALEWVSRRRALREAGAGVDGAATPRGRARAQARLFMELARWTRTPIEPLPHGARPVALLSLYREALRWTLASVTTRASDEAKAGDADLAVLWASVPPELLQAAAPEADALEGARKTLLAPPASGSLDVSAEEAARAGAFVEALLWTVDAPQRTVNRLLGQRWLRTLLLGAAAVVLAMGLSVLSRGPNLAAGRPLKTSSSWDGCATDPPCTKLLFHTEHQQDPWVEIDLGASKRIRRMEIGNREDFGSDRAVPLVAEVSDDQKTWTEVGRRETDFVEWTLKFPPRSARYVRLRVPRVTALHLKKIVIR